MLNRRARAVVAALVMTACSRSTPTADDAGGGVGAARKALALETPRDLLIAFAAQKECSGRGAFIVNPTANLPLLLARSGANCEGAAGYASVDDSDCGENFRKAPPPVACSAYLVYTKPDDRRLYVVTKTATGLKIDWRASVAYSPMTIAAYRAKQPSDPLAFRVKVRLTDSFHYDFRSAKQTHYSIHISDLQNDSITGYIPKASPDAEKLFKVLEDAKEHFVVLELQYPPGANSETVLITRFVHSWWAEKEDGF